MKGAAAPFPWQDVIAFGLGVLHLAPDALWSLTPREIVAAMAARRGGRSAPPSRTDLAALMADFPDEET